MPRGMPFDPTLPPTHFQRRVLKLFRALGPCALADLRRHCRGRGEAIRHAAWLLRRGGFVVKVDHQLYDVTAAGRCFLQSRSSK